MVKTWVRDETEGIGQEQANSIVLSKEEPQERKEDAVDCGRVDDSVFCLGLTLESDDFFYLTGIYVRKSQRSISKCTTNNISSKVK